MSTDASPVPAGGDDRSGLSSLEGSGRVLTPLALRLMKLAQVLGGAAAVLGLLVLVGYATRLGAAIQGAPGLPPMYPITASVFIAAGIGVTLQRSAHPAGRIACLGASGTVLAFGVTNLAAHAARAGPTILDLWPAGAVVRPTTAVPGRPVAETGLAFALLGSSLVLGRLHRAPRTGQALAIGALMIGVSALLGYTIGVNRSELGASLVGVGMAVHTAAGIAGVALGALLSRPGVGLLRVVTDAGPGGRLSRRLLLVALLAPVTLAALNALLVTRLSVDGLASSWSAALQVVALGLLIVVPIGAIEQYEAAAARTVERVQRDAEATSTEMLLGQLLAADLYRPLPDLSPGQVAFAYEPAHGHLAGDSFQLLRRDDDTLLLAVIDVAGHDATAGVLAFRLRVQLQSLWTAGLPLEAILVALNTTVHQDATIATMILLELDRPGTRTRYVNAGHPPGIVQHRQHTALLERSGPVLGLRHADHQVHATELEASALVTLYTDGLTEAEDSERTQLGETRVLEVIAAFAAEGPEAVVSALLDTARAHSNGRLRDDVLIVALRVP